MATIHRQVIVCTRVIKNFQLARANVFFIPPPSSTADSDASIEKNPDIIPLGEERLARDNVVDKES